MNKALKPMVGMFVVLGCVGARAQGIPVIDLANLAQTVQQVIHDITQITNQVHQIMQIQEHLKSTNGKRKLGNVSRRAHTALHRPLPCESFTVAHIRPGGLQRWKQPHQQPPPRVVVWRWRCSEEQRAEALCYRSPITSLPAPAAGQLFFALADGPIDCGMQESEHLQSEKICAVLCLQRAGDGADAMAASHVVHLEGNHR